MALFLGNLTGLVERLRETEVRAYSEEILRAGWNPAVNELQACLLTVAEAETEPRESD